MRIIQKGILTHIYLLSCFHMSYWILDILVHILLINHLRKNLYHTSLHIIFDPVLHRQNSWKDKLGHISWWSDLHKLASHQLYYCSELMERKVLWYHQHSIRVDKIKDICDWIHNKKDWKDIDLHTCKLNCQQNCHQDSLEHIFLSYFQRKFIAIKDNLWHTTLWKDLQSNLLDNWVGLNTLL